MREKEKITGWQYINPVCLAVSVVGLMLYLEVDYLDMAVTGIGLWGVTGLLNIAAQKKK
tara:strand:- start:183 stop:359 length:177 start_codon:yes stop_codon:yes gene_type:complete